MAQRRMIGKDVVQTEKFLSLPFRVQAFYFQLIMSADDEGFIDNPIERMNAGGFEAEDLLTLLGKRYLIGFSTGIVAVTHWHVQNKVRKDRACPTVFSAEKALLTLLPTREYRPFKSPEDNGIFVLYRDFSLIFSPKGQKDWMDWDDIPETELSHAAEKTLEKEAPRKNDADAERPKMTRSDPSRETEPDQENYFKDPNVDCAFKDFLEARKSLKASNDPHTVSLLIKKLGKYPQAIQLAAIQEAMMNNWKGVFPESIKAAGGSSAGILDGWPEDFPGLSLSKNKDTPFADYEEVG